MTFDAHKALITYAGVLTAVVVGVLTTGAMRDAGPGRFTTLDVERINMREPDGTLRLVISNRDSFPEMPWRGGEIEHPTRDTAGLLFINDEGTESGGLVWGGYERDGRRYSSGSLTFDGYEQDQTVRLVGHQDGPTRRSGLDVWDRPEASMNPAAAAGFAACCSAFASTRAEATGNPRRFASSKIRNSNSFTRLGRRSCTRRSSASFSAPLSRVRFFRVLRTRRAGLSEARFMLCVYHAHNMH